MHDITAQTVLAYMKGYIDQAVQIHENNLYIVNFEFGQDRERERAIVKELKRIQEKFDKVCGDWLADMKREEES